MPQSKNSVPIYDPRRVYIVRAHREVKYFGDALNLESSSSKLHYLSHHYSQSIYREYIIECMLCTLYKDLFPLCLTPNLSLSIADAAGWQAEACTGEHTTSTPAQLFH